jgi:hypothetical protein
MELGYIINRFDEARARQVREQEEQKQRELERLRVESEKVAAFKSGVTRARSLADNIITFVQQGPPETNNRGGYTMTQGSGSTGEKVAQQKRASVSIALGEHNDRLISAKLGFNYEIGKIITRRVFKKTEEPFESGPSSIFIDLLVQPVGSLDSERLTETFELWALLNDDVQDRGDEYVAHRAQSPIVTAEVERLPFMERLFRDVEQARQQNSAS